MSMNKEDEPTRFPSAIHAVRDSRTSHLSRTLIICLDGTGDQFDNDNSNVVNFVACLKKDDPRQITYYQSGIGTYHENGLQSGISAVIDMSVGSGLGLHIKDAYRFLMQNYQEGDKICLFGFSRGAYTARCLAGMLHKVGLLPAHNRAQINFAYNFYKNDSDDSLSADFKKTFCTDVKVYFVGVWDSVASVGIIPRTLPFSRSATNIGYFRHAMALDERRAKFKTCQYSYQEPKTISKTSKTDPQNMTNGISETQSILKSPETESDAKEEDVNKIKKSFLKRAATQDYTTIPDSDENLSEAMQAEFEEVEDEPRTDVLEVWFCGGHADVGGGAVKNSVRHVLARIPLRWMIRQCFECNTGIIFKTAALAETGIDVHTVWPVYEEPKRPVVGPSPVHIKKYEAGEIAPLQKRSTSLGLEPTKNGSLSERSSVSEIFGNVKKMEEFGILPEQAEDYFDSLAPINDQLQSVIGWWILEFLPVVITRQKQDSDDWEEVLRPNLGGYRAIRCTEPKMHWTVEQRMLEKRYQVGARTLKQANWKVVV